MIGHRAIKAKPAEPAIGKVEMNLFAEPTLRADAHAITDDQHPDHQFRIDGGPPRVAVIGPNMLADAFQINEAVDRTQQIIRWHMVLNAEAVKQRFLHHRSLAHHQHNSQLQLR